MVSDRTALGTLDISSLGIGTISWNKADSPELTEVVKEAMARGLNFYDTAERYGSSGLEVAFGLGWGQCERGGPQGSRDQRPPPCRRRSPSQQHYPHLG